jgi:hypothetical protein
MNDISQKLLKHISNELPLYFLNSVKDEFPKIYHESYHRGHDDPAWGEHEANYLVPHFRRSMAEKFVRDAANQCGLNAIVRQNSKKTSEFTIVSSGRLLFTISHVTDESKIRHAKFRQKNAEINYFLSSSATLPGLDITKESLEIDKIDVYAILIHSDNLIQFAIPDATGRKWIDKFNLNQLIELKLTDASSSYKDEDKAHPRFKKLIKKDEK